MKKADIVARVAARLGVNKFSAEGAVDIVFDAVAEGLAKEEDVRIAGFGTFRTRSRAARTGRKSLGPARAWRYRLRNHRRSRRQRRSGTR